MIARPRPWDWDIKLAEHFERWSRRSFAWGRSDCALYVAEWVALLAADKRIATRHRGKYRSRAGAISWLAGLSLAEAVTRELGEPVAWPLLRRGDVVLMPGADEVGGALGICDGSLARFLSAEGDGLTIAAMIDPMVGWPVGG